MRSKNILSIVAFVTAFGLSAAFAGLFISQSPYSSSNCYALRQSSPTAIAITVFISADIANGNDRDGKIYDIGEDFPPDVDSVNFTDYVEATENYVNESSSMQPDNLPSDFQSAWREHMKAWSDYSNFLNDSKNVSNQDSDQIEGFREADYQHSVEINRTWYKVLRIGRSYGANVR